MKPPPHAAPLDRGRAPIAACAALACLVLAVSCGDPLGTDDDPDPDPDPETATACETITLDVSGADPLSTVRVTGFIADEFGDRPAGWLAAGDRVSPFALHPDAADSTAVFTVPVHPAGPDAGGETSLVFVSTDGELECSGFSIDLDPLPAGTGETGHFIEVFQAGLEDLLADYGLDVDSLLAEPVAELDPTILPLAAAHHLLASPTYENDLAAILAGEAPILGDDTAHAGLRVMDALAARAGLADLAADFFDQVPRLPAGSGETAAARTGRPAAASRSGPAVGASIGSINTVTPAELAQLMAQREAFGKGELAPPEPGGEFVDLQGALYGIGAGVFGAVHEASMGATTATLGALQNLVRLAMPHLLPSELDGLTLAASPTGFNEDSESTGSWSLQMDVLSQGTTVQRQLLSVHLPPDRMMENDVVLGMLQEVNDAFVTTLDDIGASLFGFASGDGVELLPSLWTVFVDTEREREDEYFEWDLEHIESWNGEPALELMGESSSDMEYRPLGEGTARLEVGPVAERFGFLYEPRESAELVVHPIGIELEPALVAIDIVEAEPSEFEVDISAQVEFADDPSLEWREAGGRGMFDVHDELGHSVTYHVPYTEGLYELIAEASTESGPRMGGMPPRTERVLVQVGEPASELTVHPDVDCVPLDGTVDFTITDGERVIPAAELTWQVDGPGTLSEAGIFTPSAEGGVAITFEYEDAESGEVWTATASFLVRETCASVSVESDVFTYVSGCVASEASPLNDHPDSPYDWSTISAAGWAPGGGADLIVGLEADIRDEGSWERTFDRAESAGSAGSGTYWDVPTFYDAAGDEWEPLPGYFPEPGEEVLHLAREEEAAGDDMIPLYSGTFQLTLYNYTESVREDLYPDEWTTSVVEGTFEHVPYSEGTQICP